MKYNIALIGKGGSGKTFLISNLLRLGNLNKIQYPEDDSAAHEYNNAIEFGYQGDDFTFHQYNFIVKFPILYDLYVIVGDEKDGKYPSIKKYDPSIDAIVKSHSSANIIFMVNDRTSPSNWNCLQPSIHSYGSFHTSYYQFNFNFTIEKTDEIFLIFKKHALKSNPNLNIKKMSIALVGPARSGKTYLIDRLNSEFRNQEYRKTINLTKHVLTYNGEDYDTWECDDFDKYCKFFTDIDLFVIIIKPSEYEKVNDIIVKIHNAYPQKRFMVMINDDTASLSINTAVIKINEEFYKYIECRFDFNQYTEAVDFKKYICRLMINGYPVNNKLENIKEFINEIDNFSLNDLSNSDISSNLKLLKEKLEKLKF